MKVGLFRVARPRAERQAIVASSVALALAFGLSACRDEKPKPADISPPATGAQPTGSAPSDAQAAPSSDVTTAASPTWSEGPKVVTGGTVDADALRKRSHARIEGDASAVHVLEGGTPFELGKRACEASVPKVPKETKILVKPNLGGFEWFKDPAQSGGDDGLRGRITDPEFSRGIVRCLKERGHTRITLAEGWGAKHADWERLVRVSGYEAMAREEHVPLVAMDDDGVFDVEGDMPGKPLALKGMEKTHVPTLLIPKILAEHLESGLFISAPKIKAHRFGVFSAAIKGMQGTVMLSDKSPAFNQKFRMHKELGAALAKEKAKEPGAREAYVAALDTFAERIADVLEVSAPHVVIAEGAPAMGGDGFSRQWPTKESVAIAGTNPIRVDRVIAQYLGFWKNEALGKELLGNTTSPLLTKAAKRFRVDIESPTLAGNGASLLAEKRPAHLLGMAGFVIHEGPGVEVKPGSAAPTPKAPPALEPDAGAPTEAPGEGDVHAARISEAEAPKLDGALEATWNKAKPVRFDTDWSGKATGTFTEARFLWGPKGLYVAWELEGAGLHTDTSRPTDVERERLYQEDCVEIFLVPDPARKKRYFEVEVGPFGHYFDIDVDREKRKEDIAWQSGVKVGTARDAARKRATIEMAMTSPDVIAALGAGKRLPLGLYRMEGKEKRLYLAFRPTLTPKPNFHVPEAFGALVLDP